MPSSLVWRPRLVTARDLWPLRRRGRSCLRDAGEFQGEDHHREHDKDRRGQRSARSYLGGQERTRRPGDLLYHPHRRRQGRRLLAVRARASRAQASDAGVASFRYSILPRRRRVSAGKKKETTPATRVCSGCGCTDDRACPGGCAWHAIDPPLCTTCHARKREREMAARQLPLDFNEF